MKSMDSPTFEALQRIMELIRPRAGAPKELHDDWLQVSGWMREVEKEIDDLEPAISA